MKEREKTRGPKPRYGTSIRQFYRLFIEPFTKAYSFSEDQHEEEDIPRLGVEAFFGVEFRSVLWARARSKFEMPGAVWDSLDKPHIIYAAGGRRNVNKGDELIVREDIRTPDRTDIEFDGQVFMLTAAQYQVIKPKIERIA